jgi:hypothetical protein
VKQLTKAILEQRFGPVHVCDANDAQTLRDSYTNRQLEHCLISFDTPDDILGKLIVQSRIPTLLTVQPFPQLFSYCLHHYSTEFHGAYRAVTKSLSTLRPIVSASNVVPLRVSDEESLLRVGNRIATCLDIRIDETSVRTAVSNCYPDTEIDVLSASRLASPHTETALATYSELVPEQRSLISKLATSYEALMRAEAVSMIRWPTDTLVNADTTSQLAGPIELTGPGRLLTFGPYLYVPKGLWNVTITLSTSGNISGNLFMIDIFSPASGKLLVVGKCDLPVAGAFSTKLEIDVESGAHPLEIRTFIPTGAIEGILEIVDISLTPIHVV